MPNLGAQLKIDNIGKLVCFLPSPPPRPQEQKQENTSVCLESDIYLPTNPTPSLTFSFPSISLPLLPIVVSIDSAHPNLVIHAAELPRHGRAVVVAAGARVVAVGAVTVAWAGGRKKEGMRFGWVFLYKDRCADARASDMEEGGKVWSRRVSIDRSLHICKGTQSPSRQRRASARAPQMPAGFASWVYLPVAGGACCRARNGTGGRPSRCGPASQSTCTVYCGLSLMF